MLSSNSRTISLSGSSNRLPSFLSLPKNESSLSYSILPYFNLFVKYFPVNVKNCRYYLSPFPLSSISIVRKERAPANFALQEALNNHKPSLSLRHMTYITAGNCQWHLLQPQLLHTLQPPSKIKFSPHSGQYKRSEGVGVVTARGLGALFASSWPEPLFSFNSFCISLYISIRALPTAIGQQAPLLVSFRLTRRAV